jgi:hypothetical protein
MSVTGDPVSLTGSRVSVTGDPVSLTGSRVSVTGDPVSLTGSRMSVTGDPVSLTGQRVSVTDGLVSVTDGLVSVTGDAVSVTGVRVSFMGEPVDDGGASVALTARKIDRAPQLFFRKVAASGPSISEVAGRPGAVPGQVPSHVDPRRHDQGRTIMSTTQGKNSTVSRVKQLVTGTAKHYPNGSQELFFGGETRTVSAVAQLLQSFVDLREAVLAAQATSRTRVAAEHARAPALLAVIDEYVTFVRAAFGAQPDVLADFGLAPPKARATPTAEQKAAAAAKRASTRAARHTMGKNQKKSVKGAVTTTVVVTPSPGSPPVTSPAPASPSGATPPAPATPATRGT